MSSSASGAQPKKILVVDDNEIIIKTIALKLQGAGYQVITAMDGSEAVSLARKEIPDLILLDLSFPPDVGGVPWDGFRIMEWFHRLDASKKIPIIVITGSERAETKERATAAGAVAFFQKPLEHDYLLKVVRATLGETDSKPIDKFGLPAGVAGLLSHTFGRERSSVGRASPCQGERRGFKSLRSLHFLTGGSFRI